MAYLFLVGAFTMNAAANILLKLAAMRGFSFKSLLQGHLGVTELYVAAAMVFFAGNLACYVLALETFPLSVAYPILIGMTFLITLVAALFLGEQLSFLLTLGIVLIFLGVGCAVVATR